MDFDDFDDLGPLAREADYIDPFNALRELDRRWFTPATRRARWMDLLGDYAGTELFIVSGESLLEKVLNDHLLAIGRDGDLSFQILHAYYVLEQTLFAFTNRRANFEIVFWERDYHSTVSTGDSSFIVSSRCLARLLLFKHLLTLHVDVHIFKDLDDPSWHRFERDRRPMFAMVNDGGVISEGGFRAKRALLQRVSLLKLINSGVAIALLNGVEFENSKISTFIYHEAHQRNQIVLPRVLNHAINQAELSLNDKMAQYSSSLYSLAALRSPPTQPSVKEQRRFCLIQFSQRLLRNISSEFKLELLYIFILHSVILPELSLTERAQATQPLDPDLFTLLSTEFLPKAFLSASALPFDIDGRIFISLIRTLITPPVLDVSEIVGTAAFAETESIWGHLSVPVPNLLEFRTRFRLPASSSTRALTVTSPTYRLLPFNRSTVSSLLWPDIAVEEDSASRGAQLAFGVPFSDTKHWHNDKSILPSHLGGEERRVPLDERARRRENRKTQRYMAVLQKNASTLTGALGTGLQQITIVAAKNGAQTTKKRNSGHTTGKKEKNVLTSVQKARQKIEQEKTISRDDSSLKWWQEQLDGMKLLSTDQQLEKVKALFRNKRSEEAMIGLEMRLYALHLILLQWIETPRREEASVRDAFTLAVMKDVKSICDRKALSPSAAKSIETVLVSLGFSVYIPSLLSNSTTLPDKPPSFEFKKLLKNKLPRFKFMAIEEHPIVWQLRLFGEFMDRSMDSAADSRVSFKPDAWQREVLDCIDERFSVLVIAPTSAGKTFISYYSMEKVLRESDEGILVYVAPTKALVTQIAAEVYARFNKHLHNQSLWAIHTRDYRINDPQKCQILVTVPEILATLLLSPPLARIWTPRLKSIILDEIHTIGQQEGGSVWEEIILMAPCPIIGLSATIGFPEGFSEWLGSVQQAHGFQYRAIVHPHRYSHLRKFYYDLEVALDLPKFEGLHACRNTRRSRFLHPISLLSFGSRSLPADLALEASDTLALFRALLKHVSGCEDMEPTVFFSAEQEPALLVQKDIIRYETALKSKLTTLMEQRESTATTSSIIDDLQDPNLRSRQDLNTQPSRENFLKNLIFLLSDLHTTNELPAILFLFDRTGCELVAQELLSTLQGAEAEWKEASPSWKKKVKQWEDWKLRKKARERAMATLAKNRKKDEEPVEAQAEQSHSWESSFDPEEPCAEFSFAGTAAYSKSELANDIQGLTRWSNTPQWVGDALRRGVGIHHAGMNKKYRSIIESLFRRGFIRVMIATGTLALGINAPAKTAIFCGDSPFLTALMYRQCAGRAGRRGFDLLGNVIFYGLPMERVQRLVLSKLPALGGNFPLTSSLSLRLMNLLHGSNDAPVAVEAVQSFLRLPRISFASGVGRDQVLHHMRFSIEYLRRSGLLHADGSPMDLFSLAAHLYYHEPSNFALIAILKSGVLHSICEQPDVFAARRELMLVMAHLFGRRYLSRVYENDDSVRALAKSSPSMIVLPALPEDVRQVLQDHDQKILHIFTGYARACAAQLEANPETADRDNRLPLSNLSFPGSSAGASTLFRTSLRRSAIRVTARSPFVATSGHTDDSFSNVEELARSARNGLHLNNNAIPSMKNLAAADGVHVLNAYILDFYTHGQEATLTRANGIRRGDVWYLLQDFSMTLAVIELSLKQLLMSASDGFDAADPFSEDPAEMDEDDGETDSAKDPLQRPPGVKESDWKLYTTVREAQQEFDAKFKAMWA